MNPVPLFLIIVTLPLLLGGCGEKTVSEVKPEEPVAETKPKLEGVNQDELERREGIMYLKGSDTPYTGKVYGFHPNGEKRLEFNYKNGKGDGLWLMWYENGQKWNEVNFKDGWEDGLYVRWHEKNGEKKEEKNWKDGKLDGLVVEWHENGQKRLEVNYKDGKEVEDSAKYWNSKGEPVDSEEEALGEPIDSLEEAEKDPLRL